MSFPSLQTRRAFTLIEILIVVVILGIIAAIVIPHFSNATYLARDATLKDDLRFLRLQVQVYKAQHRDVPPGYAAGDRSAVPDQDSFVAQMTQFSNELADTSAMNSGDHRFGPYISRLPENPMAGRATVYIVGDGETMPTSGSLPIMDGAAPFGWIFKPYTQEWMANLAGSDENGVDYAKY